MAEQQSEAYKKKQEELRAQYEKEQDLHENKALLSKDSKDKLSVNFMYEPPPGVKKERERDDNEPEYKFEWQRKYNAPRESYCKGDTEIRDQPFGIQVRNVRCIKCHKWGHINTDKECTMYSISMSEARKIHSEAEANQILSKGELEEQMKEDGLAMKKGAMDVQSFQTGRLHQFLPSNGEPETNVNPEAEFLKSLTTKQKKKLLKKLQKIEKIKRKGKQKKSKKASNSDSSSSSSSSDSDSDSGKCKKRKPREKDGARMTSKNQGDRERNREIRDSKRDDRDGRRERERDAKKRDRSRSRSREHKRRRSVSPIPRKMQSKSSRR